MKFTERTNERELANEKKRNFQERIWFIKYWANFMRTHADEEWSKGQSVLIDSQLKNSRYFYKNKKGAE